MNKSFWTKKHLLICLICIAFTRIQGGYFESESHLLDDGRGIIVAIEYRKITLNADIQESLRKVSSPRQFGIFWGDFAQAQMNVTNINVTIDKRKLLSIPSDLCSDIWNVKMSSPSIEKVDNGFRFTLFSGDGEKFYKIEYTFQQILGSPRWSVSRLVRKE